MTLPRARISWRRLRAAAVLSGAALGVACGHSAPTEFLTLQPVPPQVRSPSAPGDPVRVAAVHLPPWLDRLEVTRPTEGAAVVVEDFERWSAPVGDLALAALTEDLADRLAGVTVLPARAIAPPATRDVTVDLTSLTRRGTSLELDGAATVTDARTGALILSLPISLRTPASAGAPGEARALDELMGELADRLAPALRAGSVAGR
ncbi:MAG: hypothetical protein JWO83_1984 [Caulobacteraceae bacterium]|jgi:uncharacterized lipoprotein YmbA|nr:hypothetical protein [Caulobacteraceae bacterium]